MDAPKHSHRTKDVNSCLHYHERFKHIHEEISRRCRKTAYRGGGSGNSWLAKSPATYRLSASSAVNLTSSRFARSLRATSSNKVSARARSLLNLSIFSYELSSFFLQTINCTLTERCSLVDSERLFSAAVTVTSSRTNKRR